MSLIWKETRRNTHAPAQQNPTTTTTTNTTVDPSQKASGKSIRFNYMVLVSFHGVLPVTHIRFECFPNLKSTDPRDQKIAIEKSRCPTPSQFL